MKKILSFLLLILSVNCALAAYQYNLTNKVLADSALAKNNKLWYSLHGKWDKTEEQGYFTFDSQTSLSMSATSEGVISQYLWYKDIVDYGYYNISDEKLVSNRNGYLGTFDEKDKIGIWIKNSKGQLYTSTKTDIGGAIFDRSSQRGESKVYCIYADGLNVLWGDMAARYEYTFEATPVQNGQPLPGVISSLLVGASALSLGKRGRRKKA